MRIELSAEELAKLVRFDLGLPLDPTGLDSVMVTNSDGDVTDDPKLFEGHKQYRLEITAYDLTATPQRQLRNVSLKILRKPAVIVPNQQGLKLTGRVWITPYVTSGNRQGYSIVAEGIAGSEQK